MQLSENPVRVQLDKILLVTECPPWADVAVPYALALARDRGAQMHVVHPVSTHMLQKLTDLPQGGAHRQSWRDLVLRAATRQVVVDADVMAAQLRQVAQRHDFDLIVVSVGRAEVSREQALADLLENVFRDASCPVLLIGPAVDSGLPARREPATILYATDFSPHALAAAQHAFSWAQEYQSWVTLLHVIDGIGSWTDVERDRLEAPFRAWMHELVPSELPIWCEIEHRIEFGRPAEKIVATAAELHADLIVVGLTGMDGVTQNTPGSTALEVIAKAPCPVLVVRDSIKHKAARPAARDRRKHLLATAA